MIVSLSASAWSQERLPEEAAAGQWLFTPGRVELGEMAGGGFSVAEKTRPTTLFAFLPRLGYVFVQQDQFLPGSLEIVGEPTYFTVFQHRTVHVGGLAALLTYNVSTGTAWTPYLVGGAGVSFASHRFPPDGTNFNFMTENGLGLHYAIGAQSTVNLDWRYHYFSNADIPPRNPGLNGSLCLIGVLFLYRQAEFLPRSRTADAESVSAVLPRFPPVPCSSVRARPFP